MWRYNIDHENGILQIRYAINDVEITDVIINGVKEEYMDGEFSYDRTQPLDVKVVFTHRGQHSMTTHYTPEFNARFQYPSGIQNPEMENVQFEVNGRTIIIKNVAGKECQILKPDGIVIYQDKTKAQTQEYTCPTPGIYIVRVGEKNRKIVVR